MTAWTSASSSKHHPGDGVGKGAVGVRAAWGCRGSAELQVAAQGVKRGKPEGDRRAVGRGPLEGRPHRRGVPAQGSFQGRLTALYFGFSGERWPFMDEYWRKEESKQFSPEKWRRLLIASLELSSKCSKQLSSTKTACVFSPGYHQGSTARMNSTAWVRPRCC